jgi:isocitrate/isopropylmalate dehydrogenase
MPMFRDVMAQLLTLLILLALTGCASTRVQTTGQAMAKPLCETSAAKGSVSVLWGPVWRADQKEPPLREAAALKGIKAYFEAQACINPLHIQRVEIPADHAQLLGPKLIDLARAHRVEADRVVLLVVRELGPKLLIGIPMLIEGGTEVVLEAQVADRVSATSLAQVQTHWQKGGPFYIKGVKSLDQDMRTVLGLLFDPPAVAPAQ